MSQHPSAPPPASPTRKPWQRTAPLLRWLPALAWMASIFTASGEGGSHQGTSRYFYPFFNWLIPGIQASTLDLLHFLFRKGAHVAGYAVLAMLLWFAVGKLRSGWQKVWLVWGIAVLYAATDEFHQSFVPSRGASVADVALDSAGAALGIAAIWAVSRIWTVFRERR